MADRKYCIWNVHLKNGTRYIVPMYPPCWEDDVLTALYAEGYSCSDILAIKPYIELYDESERSR